MWEVYFPQGMKGLNQLDTKFRNVLIAVAARDTPTLPYWIPITNKMNQLVCLPSNRENLELMRTLGDSAAQGRACGNLGNTYYLLGDFQKAIFYHNERLKIAREFGDKPAERRANSNLGNSHIFLGEFEKAAQHYK